jgi:hypothetical protein
MLERFAECALEWLCLVLNIQGQIVSAASSKALIG